MLKTILSVSGKPGLFRLVSNAKNMVIVESLTDKRRLPIYARDKVVSLGDIAMYTDEGEVPLSEVLTKIQVKENGAQASVATNSKPDVLKKYFAEILPTYDRDRVYDTDIKKLISWYNLLSVAGIAFASEEEAASTPEVNEEAPVAEVAAKEEEAPQEEKPKRKPRAKKEDK